MSSPSSWASPESPDPLAGRLAGPELLERAVAYAHLAPARRGHPPHRADPMCPLGPARPAPAHERRARRVHRGRRDRVRRPGARPRHRPRRRARRTAQGPGLRCSPRGRTTRGPVRSPSPTRSCAPTCWPRPVHWRSRCTAGTSRRPAASTARCRRRSRWSCWRWCRCSCTTPTGRTGSPTRSTYPCTRGRAAPPRRPRKAQLTLVSRSGAVRAHNGHRRARDDARGRHRRQSREQAKPAIATGIRPSSTSESPTPSGPGTSRRR